MPKIIAIAAISIDGRIATHPDQQTDWTSAEDASMLKSMLAAENSLVIVGMSTYRLYAERLTKRNCLVFTRSVPSTERKNEKLLFYNPAGGADLKEIIKNFDKVFVLGGAHIYGYFLENGLLDELYLTIEPLIFGSGINLLNFVGTNAAVRASLLFSKVLNNQGTLLLCYGFPKINSL